MRKIYILNGSGGVGKDTFVNFISEYLKNKNVEVFHISIIDKVKTAAYELGWNGVKDEFGRKMLSDLKEMMSVEDALFDYLRERVDVFKSLDHKRKAVIFIDIRETWEVDKAKKEFEAETILIRSNRVARIFTNKADAGVENYNYDWYIRNDEDLTTFREKAINFADSVILD